MVTRRLDYKIAGLVTGLLAGVAGEGTARAVPNTMTQQGRLLDREQLTPGTQSFVFSIYSAASGGIADRGPRRRMITLRWRVLLGASSGPGHPFPTNLFTDPTIVPGDQDRH